MSAVNENAPGTEFRSVCEKNPTSAEQMLNYNIELCSVLQAAVPPVQFVSMKTAFEAL